jgi:hypothetical protein
MGRARTHSALNPIPELGLPGERHVSTWDVRFDLPDGNRARIYHLVGEGFYLVHTIRETINHVPETFNADCLLQALGIAHHLIATHGGNQECPSSSNRSN